MPVEVHRIPRDTKDFPLASKDHLSPNHQKAHGIEIAYMKHEPTEHCPRERPMPILAKEPACYPDNLFETQAPSPGQRWWVFYTRPRSEKAIARHLRARHTAYFLPLYKKYSKVHGRTLVSWNVLFPSYIFVFGTTDAKLAALKTNLVVHELAVPDQDEFHQDLLNINRVQDCDLPIYPEQKLKPGTRVTVSAGPLMGLSGTIVSWLSPIRLIVELRLLQRGVCVELEPWMVSLP